MEAINSGDIVCLSFDSNKRFLVESATLIDGKIRVLYFSDFHGKIKHADIEPNI